MNDVKLFKQFQKSPIFFIEKVWNLTPQPVKPEFKEIVDDLIARGDWDTVGERDAGKKKWNKDWFALFEKGKHITWQQWLILLAVERALQGKDKRKISVISGHGIGKDTTLAWLIFWFLFCFKDAQIPCTAPTSAQLYDVLWKEIALWHKRMPEKVSNLFEWSTQYLRIKESPETWFARARTASKDQPEAIAGVHGDYVMIVADEASGVLEEVFTTGRGALTATNTLVLLVSNGTRSIGTFHDSHFSNSYQKLSFDGDDSPIVSDELRNEVIAKNGIDSDEFRVRIKGLFPKEDTIDDKGFVPLLIESDLHYCPDIGRLRNARLGIDPSGQGDDVTAFVVRDGFKAKIAGTEKFSTSKSIAEKGVTLSDVYGISDVDVVVDNFGEGANVAQDMMRAGMYVQALNVGGRSEDDRFLNKKAEGFWKLREWLKTGGELTQDERWKELLQIRYKRNLQGKIQIMSKDEMRKQGIKSPNFADAFMLTFLEEMKRNQKEELGITEVLELSNVY